MKNESRIVNCRGCGGTGQQGHYGAFSKPHDCPVCSGNGKVKMNPHDSWCGRCSGTGMEQAGFPGFEHLKPCHICGGSGIVQI